MPGAFSSAFSSAFGNGHSIDITLTVIREAPPDPDGQGLQIGDVLNVRISHPQHRVDAQCRARRMAWIVITEVPHQAVHRLKSRLTERWEMPFDPDLNYIPIVRQRRWNFDFTQLPVRQRQALRNAPHYLELTWTQFRNRLMRSRDRNEDRSFEDIETNG